ncbi:Unknown protein, partial [Striga hermonthica]
EPTMETDISREVSEEPVLNVVQRRKRSSVSHVAERMKKKPNTSVGKDKKEEEPEIILRDSFLKINEKKAAELTLPEGVFDPWFSMFQTVAEPKVTINHRVPSEAVKAAKVPLMSWDPKTHARIASLPDDQKFSYARGCLGRALVSFIAAEESYRGRVHELDKKQHELSLKKGAIASLEDEKSRYEASMSEKDAHQSTNHSPRRATPPPPVTNITNFLQNPEFIQGLTSLIARAMPRSSNTVPLSMLLTTNLTEHPTHTRHDPKTHAATSHATSQPHHASPHREELTCVTANPITNNQAPEEPPVQEMTAESHSAHHQRISPRPRPVSSAPHAREDLRRQIERNRLSRHSAEEIETLRKRLAELETRQKSQEDSPRHVTTSGNVIIEADSPLAPELTAEALPAK